MPFRPIQKNVAKPTPGFRPAGSQPTVPPIQPAIQEQPGFVQSVVQGVSAPVISALRIPYGIGASIGGIVATATGNKELAEKYRKEAFAEKDLGYFGKSKVPGFTPEGQTYSEKEGFPGLAKQAGEYSKIGGELASFATPFGKAKGLFQNVALGAISPAVSAAGSAIEKGKKPLDVASETALSALAGGATSGSLYSFGKAIEWLTEKAPKSIYEKAIGVPKKISMAGKSPAPSLIKSGVVGSKSSLLNYTQDIIEKSDESIGKILKENTSIKVSQQVPTKYIKDQIKNSLLEDYSESLGKEGIEKLVDGLELNRLNNYDYADVNSLNELRKEIGKKIGSSKWLMQNPSEKTQAMKAAYFALSDTIKSVDDRLPQLFKDSSVAITARDVIKRASQTDISKGEKFMDLMKVLLSSGVGGTAGLPAGVATYAGIQALGSTPVQTGLAVGLSKLGKITQGKAGQTVGETLKKVSNIGLTKK